ncbi:hypothetical protein DAEQUDRAFT_741873 [Daedalea quercina L-15889]|uniref:Uncharacterized protein n=1 Tax=Daedalea quercina L-15889 TaxID=1314783 RepID=A0A165KS32_9APHY|nr:hypothetical protein DAEQUDRAFT_741873 [Daedalea quercina L-15889]
MNDALKQLYGPLATNGSLDGMTEADRAAARERRKQVMQLRCGGGEDVQWAEQAIRLFQGSFCKHSCEFISAVGLKEKPDLSYGTSGGKRPWEFTLVPIEVGKDVEKFEEGKTLSDILISAQNGLFSVVQSTALEVEEVADVNLAGSEAAPAPADEQAQVQTGTEGSSRATGSSGAGPTQAGYSRGKYGLGLEAPAHGSEIEES